MAEDKAGKNPHAQALAKLGASKGGAARASRLSPRQRSDIARQAAEARWDAISARNEGPKGLLASHHEGELPIADLVLPCAVLDDGTRVFSHRGIMKALGRPRKGGRRIGGDPHLPEFISARNLEPFIPDTLTAAMSQPIIYRPLHGGRTAYGVDVRLLGDICKVWRDAYKAGVLLPSQEHIAIKAEVLLDGLVGVAIISLVDDATGYTQVRDREELNRILEAYINQELLPWSKTFPDEYYQQLFRLKGWRYNPPSVKRPQLVGKLTHDLVYKKLPHGVIEELKRQNPLDAAGRRRHKHFQFLTEDIGNPHLKDQLVAVTTLMRAAPSWPAFQRLFGRAFPSEGIQGEMNLGLDEDEE